MTDRRRRCWRRQSAAPSPHHRRAGCRRAGGGGPAPALGWPAYCGAPTVCSLTVNRSRRAGWSGRSRRDTRTPPGFPPHAAAARGPVRARASAVGLRRERPRCRTSERRSSRRVAGRSPPAPGRTPARQGATSPRTTQGHRRRVVEGAPAGDGRHPVGVRGQPRRPASAGRLGKGRSSQQRRFLHDEQLHGYRRSGALGPLDRGQQPRGTLALLACPADRPAIYPRGRSEDFVRVLEHLQPVRGLQGARRSARGQQLDDKPLAVPVLDVGHGPGREVEPDGRAGLTVNREVLFRRCELGVSR